MFKPVKTRKVYEEIVEQIKQLIVEGKLQPGDKLLSERELSERLNVSRASVREAFSALEMMGIITIRPGEGSFVRQVSYEGMLEPLSFLLQVDAADVLQLLEVRKILEVETAALAALRATPQDLEDIYRAMNSMVEQVNAGDIGDLGDAAFHCSLARATNNMVLIKVMNTITDLMNNTFRSSRQRLFLVEHMPEALHRSHCAIYEAVAAKDAQLARARMRDHLAMVEQAMLKLKNGKVNIVIKNFEHNDKIAADSKNKKDFKQSS
ncbi:GntR domain protein [Thermosinus carboxydivorans Nor1]|uniref:GntR domain protein n=1 Tax=Thermosinus carboxydivorans Nor1 TaxID=401526 RepID=A1HP55_9FIRM|nr:FadR/GntR family transcriptional regulator [Thermosinus carboxydivorans]EAX48163.1 GntR domain protein [Thermosinus carboxydivorans Nor1]